MLTLDTAKLRIANGGGALEKGSYQGSGFLALPLKHHSSKPATERRK